MALRCCTFVELLILALLRRTSAAGPKAIIRQELAVDQEKAVPDRENLEYEGRLPQVAEVDAAGRISAGDREAASRHETETGTDYSKPRIGTTSKGVFIGGKYIEIGIRTNSNVGKMGTDDKPSNFRGRKGLSGVGMTGNTQGFVANDQDYSIDYFLPGSPEEGFYMGYDSGNKCKNCGSSVTAVIDGSNAVATIVATHGNLKSTQEVTLNVDAKFYRVDVELKNQGTTTMNNVRFMRSHDPDNTVDQGGTYTTYNKRETCTSPAGCSAVSGVSKSDTYSGRAGSGAKVLYYSKDPKTVGSYGSSGLAPSGGVYDSRVYDSPPGVGTQNERDTYISICYKTDGLVAGGTAEFTFFVAMDDIPVEAEIAAVAAAGAVPYGTCDAYNCTSGTVKKETPKVTCDAVDCINSECCENQAGCSTMSCGTNDILKETADTLLCKGATCKVADDLDTCCDQKCSQFDVATCPETRKSNPCRVEGGNCEKACAAFALKENCPMKKDDGTFDRCQWKSCGCTERGKCSDSFRCVGGKVLKDTFPGYCAGDCTQEECCGDAAVCKGEASECPADSSDPKTLWKPRTPAPKCSRTVCRGDECCEDTLAAAHPAAKKC